MGRLGKPGNRAQIIILRWKTGFLRISEAEDGEQETGDTEVDEGPSESFFLIKPALPDDPRRAAALLAARQKNHRPLPDVNVESRDVLIPRNWNGGIQPSAVTVDTSKAKGKQAESEVRLD